MDYTPSGATSWTAVGGYFYSDNINYNQFGRLIDLSDDGKTLVANNSRPSDTGGSDNGGDIAAYTWNSGTSTWTMKGNRIKFRSPNQDLDGPISISSDGNRISFNHRTSGKVYIYDWNASNSQWEQNMIIDDPNYNLSLIHI